MNLPRSRSPMLSQPLAFQAKKDAWQQRWTWVHLMRVSLHVMHGSTQQKYT